MSERPTPETDALASELTGAVIWPEFARRLEREIDKWKTAHDVILKTLDKTCKERDVARLFAESWQVEFEIVMDRLRGKKHPRDNGIIADDEIIPKLIVERDALQEQLDAAIMLGKLQERRHERDLEELIAAAKAVIDRWETPFWKEAAHTGAYIAALRKAVEIVEGGHL